MGETAPPQAANQRTFLVVLDETEEMHVALRFACRRAMHTGGRVALLYVLEPNDFQAWMGVGNLIRQEARGEAEKLLQRHAGEAYDLSGSIAVLHLREGGPRDAVLELMEEDPNISILVLAASTGQGGPGPLVSNLTGKMMNKLCVPVTVVPGNLGDEDVDAIA